MTPASPPATAAAPTLAQSDKGAGEEEVPWRSLRRWLRMVYRPKRAVE